MKFVKISPMTKKSERRRWDVRATIWTDNEVKAALSMVKSRLVRSGRTRFQGRRPTEESVFGALILWADAQDVDTLDVQLAPHMARLEALVKGKSARTIQRPGEEAKKRVTVKEAEEVTPPTPSAPSTDTDGGKTRRKKRTS